MKPGDWLGPYEVLAKLGEGGMGEVYKARDAALNRDVAIKVLPDSLIGDSERLARFQREAEALAALNHPNIAQIYGLEKSGAAPAIVMEMVDGLTLADRIAAGPIALDEALPIARQMAEALEAAHERGIIHRDLKPANIKVREDGTVKLLDFGLAKATEPPGEPSAEAMNSPTLTARATQMGVILGTAAYMSPEQARGRLVDKQADIWAFGVVLYEMLTGRAAFPGKTTTDVLAAVVREDPDWSALPDETPRLIRRLLGRCLTKDAKQRLHDIADARLEVEEATSGTAAAGGQTEVLSRRRALPALTWVLAVASVAVTVLAAWGWLRPAPENGPPVRFTVPVPSGHLMSSGEGPRMAVSPDGSTLAWVANDRFLYVRRLDEFESRRLDGSAGADNPFFSPDGHWIAFARDGGLSKMNVDGGPVISIAGVTGTAIDVGAHWHSSGIVYTPSGGSDGLWKVPGEGGTPQRILARRPDERHTMWPQFVDDEGRLLLYTAEGTSSSFHDVRTFVADLETGERFQLAEGGTYGRYVPTGHVVFTDGTGTVFARPVNLNARAATGPAFPVQEGVRVSFWNAGAASLQVSATGTAAFVRGSTSALHRIGWLNREGRVTGYLGGPVTAEDLRISPDGTRVLTWIADGNDADLWMLDVSSGDRTRMTDMNSFEWKGVWSSDGTRIAHQGYAAGGQAVFVRDALPGRPSTPVLVSDTELWTDSWSTDGRWVAFSEASGEKAQRNLYAADLESPGKRVAIAETAADERDGRFAPGGALVAYVSDDEVWVSSFPAPDLRRQISDGGGLSPRWSPRTNELLYWWGAALTSRAWRPEAPRDFGPPQVLFSRPQEPMDASHYWDVDPGGQRFLVLLSNPDAAARVIHVDTDWFGTLREAAARSTGMSGGSR